MRSSLGLELEREKVGFIENTAMRHREKGGFYEKDRDDDETYLI